jgi:hypothetical protein
MPRSLRALVVAFLLVLATAALAACGGGGNESASALVKDTFGGNHPVKSGKLNLALSFSAKGLSSLKGPLALKLTGPFQSVGKGKLPTFDFNVAINAGGTNLSAGAVSTGDKGWLRLAGNTYAVTDALFKQFKDGYEKSAAGSQSASSGPSFKSLGISPQHWLKNPTTVGDEVVGGTDTTHVTAGVDVGKLLDDVNTLLGKAGSLGQGAVPTKLTPQQRTDIEQSIKTATLDVWAGKKDKALRQVKVNIAFDVPAAARSRSHGLQSGALAFTLTIADLNAPQTIVAPANARPLSDLTQALAGVTGATSPGTATTPSTGTTTTPSTGTTTTPSTGTTTTPSASSSAYLTCLQSAGSDVAKIQKCAALLNK